jgi:5'-deoxynucleotidase YfbR-like HD superfamily hydrolase
LCERTLPKKISPTSDEMKDILNEVLEDNDLEENYLEEIDSEENCLEEIDLEGDDLEGKFGYS